MNAYPMPQPWRNVGNIPALKQLLCAYLETAPQFFAEAGHVVPTLGIYQNLLGKKKFISEAFDVIISMAKAFPL